LQECRPTQWPSGYPSEANAINVYTQSPVILSSNSSSTSHDSEHTVITHTGAKEVFILPDSGADLSAAETNILETLG